MRHAHDGVPQAGQVGPGQDSRIIEGAGGQQPVKRNTPRSAHASRRCTRSAG